MLIESIAVMCEGRIEQRVRSMTDAIKLLTKPGSIQVNGVAVAKYPLCEDDKTNLLRTYPETGNVVKAGLSFTGIALREIGNIHPQS